MIRHGHSSDRLLAKLVKVMGVIVNVPANGACIFDFFCSFINYDCIEIKIKNIKHFMAT